MSRLKAVFLAEIAVVAVCILSLLSPSTGAQTASTSTVSGTIIDASGAAVPNAKVELLDNDTQAKFTTTTGDDGHYTFSTVRPGSYKITVTANGFRQAIISSVKVEVGKSSL